MNLGLIIGGALILVSTALAFIGVMFNKEKHPAVKWVLVILILISCGASLWQKYRDSASSEQRALDAERERDETNDRLAALTENVFELSNKIDELTRAAKETGDTKIAAMATKTNLEASSLIVDMAERQGALKGNELKSARHKLGTNSPLTRTDRDALLAKIRGR